MALTNTSGLTDGDKAFLKLVKDHTDDVLRAMNSNIGRGLEAVGLQAERYAKEELRKKKAIDTGRLRNSVTHTVSGNSAIIGTNVEYAPYIEYGTYKMRERPFIKPAATEHAEEYKKILERYLKGG